MGGNVGVLVKAQAYDGGSEASDGPPRCLPWIGVSSCGVVALLTRFLRDRQDMGGLAGDQRRHCVG
eukprot:15363242-Alexandrium_andersonii.AAC.1